MARDFEQMEARAIQDTEELRRLRNGELVICPCDVEHARAMLKLSMFYLSQHNQLDKPLVQRDQ